MCAGARGRSGRGRPDDPTTRRPDDPNPPAGIGRPDDPTTQRVVHGDPPVRKSPVQRGLAFGVSVNTKRHAGVRITPAQVPCTRMCVCTSACACPCASCLYHAPAAGLHRSLPCRRNRRNRLGKCVSRRSEQHSKSLAQTSAFSARKALAPQLRS